MRGSLRKIYIAAALAFAFAVVSTPVFADTTAAGTAVVELPSSDSLEYIIRNDYLICTGDTSFVSRERLFTWKKRIDSLVLGDKSYGEKFNTFVKNTGLKAHQVRPCEPIAFYERLDRQMREMDSIVNATRARREQEYKDSVTLATELAALKLNPVDIFGIPGGMSKNAVALMLARYNNIRARDMRNFLQIDNAKMFDSVMVTIALRFGADDKYTGYEIETNAVKADHLDKVVRSWAALFASDYEKRLGAPNAKPRVGFRDIKQGQLSITDRWDGDTKKYKPRVAVGLATYNSLYYAKVIVKY